MKKEELMKKGLLIVEHIGIVKEIEILSFLIKGKKQDFVDGVHDIWQDCFNDLCDGFDSLTFSEKFVKRENILYLSFIDIEERESFFNAFTEDFTFQELKREYY